MLNLCCPLSSYDLNFEPSKTILEFKDWDAVLTFFEQAIKNFWKQLLRKSFQGETCASENCVPMKHESQKEEMFAIDTSNSSKMRRKKCNIHLDQTSRSRSSFTSALEISSEDINLYGRHGRPPKELIRFPFELKPCQNEAGYFGQTDFSFQNAIHDSQDSFSYNRDQIGCVNSEPHQHTSEDDDFLLEKHLFSDQTAKVKEKHDMSGLSWKGNTLEETRNLKEGSAHSIVASDPYDNMNVPHDVRYPFDCPSGLSKLGLKSCFLMDKQDYSAIYTNQSGFDFDFDHLGKEFSLDNATNAPVDHYYRESVDVRDVPLEKVDASTPSLGFIRKCQTSGKSHVISADLIDSFTRDQASFTGDNNFRTELATQMWEIGSRCKSPETEWVLGLPHSLSAGSTTVVHDFTDGYTSKEDLRCFKNLGCGHSSTADRKDELFNSVQRSCNEVLPTMRSTRAILRPMISKHYDFPIDENAYAKASSASEVNDDMGWLVSDSLKNTNTYSKCTFHVSVRNDDNVVERRLLEQEFQNRPPHVWKVRSRRSCSAPPFYRGKCKFSILNDRLNTIVGDDPLSHLSSSAKTPPDTLFSLNDLPQPCCTSQQYQSIIGEGSQSCLRKCSGEMSGTYEMSTIENDGLDKSNFNQLSCTKAVEGSTTDKLEYAKATLTKWRTDISQCPDGDISHNCPKQKDDILDISSGLLHLSGGSLVPESISKDCLEDARVLLQLDRKFIPVMAGGTLVIIDQHAADERIRVEELRRKVMSGESRGITYLDTEQELVLPEMGFQLLQKYAEQIEKWGWICSTNIQSSGSFSKSMKILKRHECGVTLVAVPCVLGINLTDKDLIEFIDQLVETDGSSTLPPSVLRILNFKACRGAIMFGDLLLPSECSLIVEELKATALCFQCAHGRPTTVPILNMSSLHEQLAMLEMQKGGPAKTWHGLRRHTPSIERAQLRLDDTTRRVLCNG